MQTGRFLGSFIQGQASIVISCLLHKYSKRKLKFLVCDLGNSDQNHTGFTIKYITYIAKKATGFRGIKALFYITPAICKICNTVKINIIPPNIQSLALSHFFHLISRRFSLSLSSSSLAILLTSLMLCSV